MRGVLNTVEENEKEGVILQDETYVKNECFIKG